MDLGGNLYLGGLEKYDAPDAANAKTGFVGEERKLIYLVGQESPMIVGYF